MASGNVQQVVDELNHWAKNHKALFKAAWLPFVVPGGDWARAEDLTRKLYRTNNRMDVLTVASQMPAALGRLEEGRVKLTIRGASYYPGAKTYLVQYVRAAAIAVRRFRSRREPPVVLEEDLLRLGLSQESGIPLFARLVRAEPWALSPAGQEDGEQAWSINTQAALALAGIKTLPKYLQAQAEAWFGDIPSRERLAFGSRYVAAPPSDVVDIPPDGQEAQLVDLGWLHPVVRDACSRLFENGHYREGVERAIAVFQEELRQMSGLALDGASLVNKALSPSSPVVDVAGSDEMSGESIRRGTHHLAAGLVAAIRNPTTHGITDPSPHEALEQVAIVSYLARQLDNSKRTGG